MIHTQDDSLICFPHKIWEFGFWILDLRNSINLFNAEWILIFKKQLDRINRIVMIERPSTEGPLAAGEKNPVNPVNPV